MELVVDANIVFAALIKAGVTHELIVDERLTLVASACLLKELAAHKDELLSKTNRPATEVEEALAILGDRVDVVDLCRYSDCLKRVESFSPDPWDDEYLALALKRGVPLWSNDVALKRQTSVPVVSTKEVLVLLEE